MAAISFNVFFILLIIFLLQSMEVESQGNSNCSRFLCEKFDEMKFPFYSIDMQPSCGLYRVNCSREIQKVQLEKGGRWYKIESISQSSNLVITDLELQESINRNNCEAYVNSSLPSSSWLVFKDSLTLFRCNQSHIMNLQGFNCKGYNFYYPQPNDNLSESSPECLKIQLPAKTMQRNATFHVEIKVPGGCYRCHYREGICSTNNGEQFECLGGKEAAGDTHKSLKLGLGLGIGFALLTTVSFTILIIKCRKRRGNAEFHSRDISNDPYSKSDTEGGNVYFKVPIFSYKELSEATNNFSSNNLLGDGGYGTVYYGKLRDGREVAVKRLYEHNYKRIEQFINEIEILARLQHKNLVSLYGCTSRRSRELLLVYEFVPHGTVADHLHGDPAKQSPLPWPGRLSIAVETASALCYLHASDIIHRDVKTNNILLDRNFSVKVADFGLSRLFPNDVTHVSTAPQGTPGYVDPEYYQCYHLSDKSDVYSFGVVLIELISSMPAVDINRHKHEINLSNLAITKIQKHALHELIDQNLGYETDEEVRITTRLVAELAFRCLQQDNEMRPRMDEVLKELKRIQKWKLKLEDQVENSDNEEMRKSKLPPSASDCEEATLLKNIILPPSPISVAEKWVSRSTTPNTSGWSSISFEAGNSKSSLSMEKPHS